MKKKTVNLLPKKIHCKRYLLSKLNRQNCVLGMIDTNRGVQKKNRLKCNSIVRVTVLIRVKIMAIFADVFFLNR